MVWLESRGSFIVEEMFLSRVFFSLGYFGRDIDFEEL